VKILNILILVFSCCAVALACGLFGCGESGGDGDTLCQDRDGDGYGTTASSSCANPGLDCDDDNADVYPGAPELCDGVDNQCQGDSAGYGIVDGDAICLCSFQGGSYLFALEKAESDCPGIDVTTLFPPGTDYGPLALPGFQDLQDSPTPPVEVALGPPVGTISMRFYSGGDDIRLEGTEPIQVSLDGVGTVTATVTGAFCPDPQGGVQADFFVDMASPIHCYVFMEAAGAPSTP
jgi:Putative metal-binding motif